MTASVTLFDNFSRQGLVAVALAATISYFVVLFLRRRLFYRGLVCEPLSDDSDHDYG